MLLFECYFSSAVAAAAGDGIRLVLCGVRKPKLISEELTSLKTLIRIRLFFAEL